MSLLKDLQKSSCHLHHWQIPCIETIDKLIASYWFKPNFQGLYIYGPPGRGKTFLIDSVHQYLPQLSSRYHFFTLCSTLHEMLNLEDQYFKSFFSSLSKRSILLIDEIIIEDIADAMLFARWFKKVQEHKIRIIMTSNIAIDNLYLGGLKRDAFMPTIEQMNVYCRKFKLESNIDLRNQTLQTKNIFFPIEEKNQAIALIDNKINTENNIELGTNRFLRVHRANQTSVALDASTIFSHDAGKFDYKFLTTKFKNIILCDLHLFLWQDKSWCKRMVSFIDYSFDHQTKIFFHGCSHYKDLEEKLTLYPWPERTLSRFKQICSQSWIKK